jgi:hypothetical protein
MHASAKPDVLEGISGPETLVFGDVREPAT